MGSWQKNLVQIYDNVMMNGNPEDSNFIRLAPIYFKYQDVGIDVYLEFNYKGDVRYLKSKIFDKKSSIKEKTVIMPSNIQAEIRTSNADVSYPLFESIKWCCNLDKKSSEKFELYQEALKKIIKITDNKYLKLLLKYIAKNRLIDDLMGDSDSKFKGLEEDKRNSLFVKFIMLEKESNKMIILENDENIILKWTEYCESMYKGNNKLCIDTNDLSLQITEFPRRKFLSGFPKIISCNDENNFTYMGRFTNKQEACNFSFKNILKIQNSMDYLIRNNIGVKVGSNQFIIIAAYDNYKIKTIKPDSSSKSLFDELLSDDFKDEFDCDDIRNELNIDYSKEVYKALNLRVKNLNFPNRRVFLMGLQPATSGRLSITFYQELLESEYLKGIANWHNMVKWVQVNNKNKIICSPSINDILKKAYKFNTKDDGFDKYINNAYIRLLNCIFHNKSIPLDILNNLFNRANNPFSFKDDNNAWDKKEWLSHINVTCSLYRKEIYDKKKEIINMSIDKENTNRSYVWGRILAVLDNIEIWARNLQSKVREKKDNRPTNVIRLFNAFALQPFNVFKIIREQINPYIAIIQKNGGYANPDRELSELISLLENYKDNRPLEPDYLFGYYLQKNEFALKKENFNSKENNENEGDE